MSQPETVTMKLMMFHILTLLAALPMMAGADEMVLREGFRLRKTASQNGETLRVTRQETGVYVIMQSEDKEWFKVCIGGSNTSCYDGDSVWVHRTGLKEPAAGDPLPSPTAGSTFYASNAGAPVRNKPGTRARGGKIIDTLPLGTKLTFMQTEKDLEGDTWYRVSYRDSGRDRQGYIFEGRVQRDNPRSENEGAGICTGPECAGGNGTTLVDLVTAGESKGYALGSGFNAKCSNFINRDGLGPWGRTMISAVDRVAPECFYDSNVFRDLCPNFNPKQGSGIRALNKSQKQAFIALVFATMGQYEATCSPMARAQGVNDIADGMFQLEHSARQRRKAGRNTQWCHTRGKTDKRGWKFQSECSVSIIEDTICKKGRKITSGSGYWEKLRGNRAITKKIRSTAKKWGLCS